MRKRTVRRYKRIDLVGSPRHSLASSYQFRLLKVRLANFLFKFAVASIIGGTIISFFLFIIYSRDLPSPDNIRRREGFSTLILDRNSKPIYDIYTNQNRIPVSFSDIPEHLKKATIAIEDKDFYQHQGFDPKGIVRAIFNIITLRGLQGGSTLTQQLVKNVLLSSERTLPRKFKEFILSVQIERKYSKDEILQMYLNESPYGGTMWGIESASEGYFSKQAKDLNLTESVILAGLPQRPSYYSPFSANDKAYLSRAQQVLRRMREDGYITAAEELEAKKSLEKIKFATPSSRLQAFHFVEYVKKQLIKRFGEKRVEAGGLKVVTTLDIELQKKAENIVKEELDKLEGLNVTNGASITIDPQSGEILSYVGSKEYESSDEQFEGKFDVVSMGLRQPGSALKPITYAVAFSKGYTPSSLIMDVETHFPGGSNNPDYVPKNYDGKHRGPVQLRFALGNSINIPAVKMTALVGVKDILKTATDMGITTLAPTDDNVNRLGLSLTLGGGEVKLIDLTSAFGVLATGGIRFEPVAILKVEDAAGKTMFENKKVKGKRVLGEDVSFLISHIMLDNNARMDVFGPRSYLVIPGKTVSVKTGTTDDKRDNWTVGYTKNAVVGVWVGNNDNTPMNPKIASGVTGATPIWNRIMSQVLSKHKDESPAVPNNVVSLNIDAFAGGLPYGGRSERSEYFIKGTEPREISSVYQKIKLSRDDSQKLANAVEIASGAYEEKEFIVFAENDPTSSGDENQWQQGIDKWLETQSDPLYHPPKETSSSSADSVVIRIKSPEDKKQYDQNDIEISADAKALKRITKIEIFVDDILRSSKDSDSISEMFSLTSGVHKIRIKAHDEENHRGEKEVTIGVKVSVDTSPPTTVSSSPLPTAVIPSPT